MTNYGHSLTSCYYLILWRCLEITTSYHGQYWPYVFILNIHSNFWNICLIAVVSIMCNYTYKWHYICIIKVRTFPSLIHDIMMLVPSNFNFEKLLKSNISLSEGRNERGVTSWNSAAFTLTLSHGEWGWFWLFTTPSILTADDVVVRGVSTS